MNKNMKNLLCYVHKVGSYIVRNFILINNNGDMNNDIIPKMHAYECLLVNEIFSHVDDVAYIQKCILLPMFLCIS